MTDKPKLTVKQQRFVDFYDGNATDAARKAGYKIPEASGLENLEKPTILKAIQEREKERNNPLIANREARQEFWTRSMFFDVRKLVRKDGKPLKVHELDDETAKLLQGLKVTETQTGEIKTEFKLIDRDKSSELLGRSEADFTDKTESDTTLTIKVVSYATKDKDGGEE